MWLMLIILGRHDVDVMLQEDEEQEVVAPRARLAPRRAAAASKTTYIDLSEDEGSEAISLHDSEDSEFEA